ncbi:protein MAIN-LIKE 1 [Sesamum angolense]|uniref:Protein MAIN-LIKE 1 n=1 Tax=Sesamum angolense TaxID=2727404 RepID=A0AAE1X2B2_9LAMI|nr:protein MAIN-LIKE 1 [Sesamum angolense]
MVTSPRATSPPSPRAGDAVAPLSGAAMPSLPCVSGRQSDSPFEEVLQEARVCALCILGGILCVDSTGNTVSLFYLRHMQDIHEDGVSNWGVVVLAYLYKELCTSSQRHKVNIGGAMQLLQIWAWSRIITIAPILSTSNTELMPTIIDEENILPHPPYVARWSYHISRTHAAHNAVRIIRNTFDRMKQNEFIWTPYGGKGPDVQSLLFYALRTPWHIKCPLIHYAIVEIHHPDRVLRQFGMIQDIPLNPPSPYGFSLSGVVPYEAGPSNAPSNVRNEAGPSNAYTPTNTAYTVDHGKGQKLIALIIPLCLTEMRQIRSSSPSMRCLASMSMNHCHDSNDSSSTSVNANGRPVDLHPKLPQSIIYDCT